MRRRVLFTFAGGQGHLDPMMPLARAMRAAGHEVGVAGNASVVTRADVFEVRFPYEPPAPATAPSTTGTLVAPDLDHELAVIGEYFVDKLGRKNAQRVRQILGEWQPDLVVCDEIDFGGMVAAECAGVRRVVVKVIASGALVRREYVADRLVRLREDNGLPERSDALEMLSRDLVLAPFPPTFRHPDFPLTGDVVSIRHEDADSTIDHPAASWLAAGDEELRVYLTLGTIFNTESGDVFTRALEGLLTLPARILVTTGHNLDPSSLPISADNIRFERFVPQAATFACADLVVNHAGSGSVIGALTRGLPLVTIPIGADQELNAERLAALTAGVRLDPMAFSPSDMNEAVLRLMSSPTARAAAQRLRREIEALPLAASVVPEIERLIDS
jgi:UDP-N-acetylglucosamine:LPS N-acetylglucosamine transferase